MPFTRTDNPLNTRRLVILLIAALLFVIVSTIGYNQEATRDPFAPEPSWQDLARWKVPVESNAFRRLPAVNSILTSVQFMEDGQRGWAVGGGGAVLTTNDGGNTWKALSSGSRAMLSFRQWVDTIRQN